MQTPIDRPPILNAHSHFHPNSEISIQSSEFYEAAILSDETIVSNYWYLGLSYLLEGREDDAQAAWFVPMSVADDIEIAKYTDELIGILDAEANRQSQLLELENAWLIRQHLWTLEPRCIENILQSIVIAKSLDRLTSDKLDEWQIYELLDTASLGELSDELLENTISSLLFNQYTDLSLNIINTCLQLTRESRENIISRLAATAAQIFYRQNKFSFSIKLIELCKSLTPDNLDVCHVLSCLYSGVDLHTEAIANAKRYYEIVRDLNARLFGSYLVQRAYLSAGNWDGYLERIDRHRTLLNDTIVDSLKGLRNHQIRSLIAASFFTPYIEDNPKVNRPLQSQIAAICQNSIIPICLKPEFEEVSLEKKVGIIRIGYLASTLKEHSVGWLSRWLFHYHNRKDFQIFIYCINQTPTDTFNHKWFRDNADISYYFENRPKEVVTQIRADEIDILIDLDSLTFDSSCLVMAYKPAPVQVTWLGWDASGIPAIDYYIADAYVLPANAQDYYQEKIWRLPQTYLAVDGFEVGIPTLNRQDLGIPDDAIVYFSSQSGYKRHPDNIRCQMRIIKSVSNSYLFIKGQSDPNMIRDLFGKIGEEEGVSLDRLRFLPGVPDEYTHRANLAIADIVLDTFPYNGATTTLETLWMGIPMVTQVGQQFAARNSYTFMINAGITEGIAWSESEYVDWGVKLGLDRDLRMQVREKLRSGRQSAPVWNAKQFTLDMEQAYREMWAKHLEQIDLNSIDPHEHN
jgi:predicted O-linked N-acetylglucosamine transferase (SPINDLY family)